MVQGVFDLEARTWILSMDYPKVDVDTSIFNVLVTSTVQYRSLTRLLPDDRLCFFADSYEILPPLSQVFLLVLQS